MNEKDMDLKGFYPPPPEFRIQPPPSLFSIDCHSLAVDSNLDTPIPSASKALYDATLFEICPSFLDVELSKQKIEAIQVKRVSLNRSRAGAIQSFYERRLLRDWITGKDRALFKNNPSQKPEIVNTKSQGNLDISKTTTFWVTLIMSSLLLASLVFILAITSYYIRKRTVSKRINVYNQAQTSRDVLKRYGLCVNPIDNQESSKTLLGYANERCKILPVVEIHDNTNNKHKSRSKLVPCVNADDRASEITDKFYYYSVEPYNSQGRLTCTSASHPRKRQYQTISNDQAELFNNYKNSSFPSGSPYKAFISSPSTFNDEFEQKNDCIYKTRRVRRMSIDLLHQYNPDLSNITNLQNFSYLSQCHRDNNRWGKGLVEKDLYLRNSEKYHMKNGHACIKDYIPNIETRYQPEKDEVMKLRNSYDVSKCFINLSKVSYSPICLSFDGTKFISHIYTDIEELDINRQNVCI